MTSTVCVDLELICFSKLPERRACALAGDQVSRRIPSTRAALDPQTPLSKNIMKCVPSKTSCLRFRRVVAGRAVEFDARPRGAFVVFERRDEHALRSTDGANRLELAVADAVVDGAPRNLQQRRGLIDGHTSPKVLFEHLRPFRLRRAFWVFEGS